MDNTKRALAIAWMLKRGKESVSSWRDEDAVDGYLAGYDRALVWALELCTPAIPETEEVRLYAKAIRERIVEALKDG